MSDSRLTKRIYLWDKSFFQLRNTQSWSSEVRDILLTHNLGHVFEPTVHFCQDNIIDQLKRSMNIKQNVDLKRQCLEKPKLRNYAHIKDFNLPSPYLTIPMPFVCRKYLALTRLSNLQIRIETARFERPKIDANFRFCQVGCGGLFVEDEYHILFICNMYNHLRFSWLNKIKTPEHFFNMHSTEKLKVVLDLPENVKLTAQFLIDICNVRSKILFSKTANNIGPIP